MPYVFFDLGHTQWKRFMVTGVTTFLGYLHCLVLNQMAE